MKQRFREWLRPRAQRLGVRIEEWSNSSNSGWHYPATGSDEAMEPGIQRLRPRRFDDLDKFDAFVDAVAAMSEKINVHLDYPQADPLHGVIGIKKAMAQAALGPAASLSSISIQGVWNIPQNEEKGLGQTHPVRAWRLSATNRASEPGRWTVRVVGPAEGRPGEEFKVVAKSFDFYTVPVTRREQRRGVALVREVRAPGAAQERREETLTKIAARRAGFWGVIAGFAGGVGGALIVKAVGG